MNLRAVRRWKILVSDFFKKAPTVILVPGILLGSFTVAFLLIFAGIKMAPVGIKKPIDPYTTQGQKEVSNNPLNNGPSNQIDGGEDNQFDNGGNQVVDSSLSNGSSDYIPNQQTDTGSSIFDKVSQSSLNEQQGRGQGTNQQFPEDNINSNQNNASNNSSGENIVKKNKNNNSDSFGSANQAPDTSDESNSVPQGDTISQNCTYPKGDPQDWWFSSSKLQRDCYVKKEGRPQFLKDYPYFCDYEKNEDCYNR